MVSQRDPLRTTDQPRIPSPRTARIREKRAFILYEIRPANKELEEAGLLPGAKPINSAPVCDCYGRPMPRPREWYYPEKTTVEQALRWHVRTWDIKHDRNLPLRRLPSKQAKAPPNPKCRVSEGQLQSRTEANNEREVMDLEYYA